ncbi:MAG: hypothetical protein ACREV1_06715 [Gammaproteobacteria bacterium]
MSRGEERGKDGGITPPVTRTEEDWLAMAREIEELAQMPLVLDDWEEIRRRQRAFIAHGWDRMK